MAIKFIKVRGVDRPRTKRDFGRVTKKSPKFPTQVVVTLPRTKNAIHTAGRTQTLPETNNALREY